MEEVIPLLYMNGISTRKVKRSLKEVLGKRGLSHQNVSRIAGKVVEGFRGWKKRRLSGLKVLYLIVDGIRLGVRAGTCEKEAVLVAQGFLEDGRRVLLSVGLGNRESYLGWKGFLGDMQERGLQNPLLIITYKDIEHCLTYYKFPCAHWKRIRTTLCIERSFREVRQRVRSIGRFQDEERALSLVYWQIKDVQARWKGLSMTREAMEVLYRLKAAKMQQRKAA